METLVIGTIASLGAGLGTVVGALPILLPISTTQRAQGISK
jgi:ZIP family zinc transporter